jgi:hypothetical protein
MIKMILNKLVSVIKRNWILLFILSVGLYLRLYKVLEGFYYTHDMDLSVWFIRDVLVNHHIRLIGQLTSTPGIFIGPFFYYLLIPFYLLFGMEPTGGLAFVTVMGIFGIWSIYHVFTNSVDKRSGIIASLIYAVSYYTVFNDREPVPTMPVIIWTVWYFYGLDRLIKGKQRSAFIYLGILIALIWNINMALVVLLPLIPVALWMSRKRLKLQNTFSGIASFLVLSAPLLLFEARHGFQQTKSFLASLAGDQFVHEPFYVKFVRLIGLLGKNLNGLLGVIVTETNYKKVLLLIMVLFLILVIKKIIKKEHVVILSLWLLLYVLFFSSYSKVVSEYYLNGTMLVWIYIITAAIVYLLSKQKLKIFGIVLISFFALINVEKIINRNFDKSGYLYKRAVVSEIKVDAGEHGYPCMSVSYLTDPGHDLGWRYLYVLEQMHVNKPMSGSPVYSIVYPLKPYYQVDNIIGAIGLIYPEYNKYNIDDITKSCEGDNPVYSEPMFGFTN